MLMPSILSNDFMDDFFTVPRVTGFGGSRFDRDFSRMMTTDVKETDNGYQLDMNLPGFAKEDIKAELKDGYLTINAQSNSSNDEKDDDGNFIRRERYTGSCSRSFYVGDAVTQDDIHAAFKDGVLSLNIPKKEAIPEKEETKYIAIEG
ncbi:MAG: Hsp20/alpha crystallin family protein [Pseudobutyrivibrio sp.]|uniref:Hsp20/alpha crystallin family protein n=1 Tax=Pseudobutyrivibrio sp. TaxID=2014367 RepID=UPI001B1FCE05|nr:Hsp20/alpha crystallin family protein [Pseudobutyrivibrio sp.]MBO5618032.1 Hsp20/alpha crystallin family protein [Pseudobutyrivibrio sp.]MBO6282769.1 Hsp20/alpha crystallin family protein [Pseudobutyrivibrio sp.]MBP3261865.1 Hsp20/alpha crystallin family protein [Pseudobutyrivibrio sp.]